MLHLSVLRTNSALLVVAGLLISTVHLPAFYYAYDTPKWFIYDVILSLYTFLNRKLLVTIKGGWLLILTLLCCISVFMSDFIAANTGAALEFTIHFLLALTTIRIILEKHTRTESLSLLSITVIASAIAFSSTFLIERYILGYHYDVGSFSPFGFINNMGQVFNIWIPICIFASLLMAQKKHYLLATSIAVLAIILVTLLMEAATRGTIIGLFLGEAVVFILMLKIDLKKALIFLSTSTLLIIGILFYSFADDLSNGRLLSKVQTIQKDLSSLQSSSGRASLFTNTARMISDNPLGVGTHNFEYYHPRYGQPGSAMSSPYVNEHQILRTPHNIVLKIYSEQGWIGGTFFVVLLLCIWLKSLLNAIYGTFSDRWQMVAITALLFHSLASAVFLTPGSLFFAVLLIASIATPRKREPEKNLLEIKQPLLGWMIPAFSICISASVLISSYYSHTGRVQTNVDALHKSLSFNPYNERAWFDLSHLELLQNQNTEASYQAIRKFTEINPYHIAGLYLKSEREYQTSNYHKALTTVNSLIDFYPGFAKAQRLRTAIRKKI